MCDEMNSPAVGDGSDFDKDAVPSRQFAITKRRILVGSLVYAAIVGLLVDALPEDAPVVEFFVGLPLLILAVAWCLTDADERDHRIGSVMRLELVFLFVLAFPIYVFQTRGLWGIKTLALAVLWIVAIGVCFFAAGLLMLFVLDPV